MTSRNHIFMDTMPLLQFYLPGFRLDELSGRSDDDCLRRLSVCSTAVLPCTPMAEPRGPFRVASCPSSVRCTSPHGPRCISAPGYSDGICLQSLMLERSGQTNPAVPFQKALWLLFAWQKEKEDRIIRRLVLSMSPKRGVILSQESGRALRASQMGLYDWDPRLSVVFSLRKKLGFSTVVHLVVIWQLMSNYGLIRIKRLSRAKQLYYIISYFLTLFNAQCMYSKIRCDGYRRNFFGN